MKSFLILFTFFFVSTINLSACWQKTNNGIGEDYLLNVLQTNNKLFAISYNYIYTSEDCGRTWIKTNKNEHSYYFNTFGNAILKYNYFDSYLYFSFDEGRNWHKSTLRNSNYLFDYPFIYYLKGDTLIKTSQLGKNILSKTPIKSGLYLYNIVNTKDYLYFNFYDTLYRMSKNDNKFSVVDFKRKHCYYYFNFNDKFIINKPNNVLYYTKSDNINWDSVMLIINEQFTYYDTIIGNKAYFLSASGKHYTFDLDNKKVASFKLSDSSLVIPNRNIFKIISISDDSIALISQDCNFFYGSKKDSVFSYFGEILSNRSTKDLFFTDEKVYAATDKGLFESPKNQWRFIRKANKLPNQEITSFALFKNSLYASTIDGLYFSTNLGESWTQQFVDSSDNQFNKVYVYKNKIYLCSISTGLFVSEDGKNWLAKNNGLLDKTIYSLTFTDNTFYLGTSDGLYIADTNCTEWIYRYLGEPSISIKAIANCDSYVIAGTSSGAVSISYDEGDTWNLTKVSEFKSEITDIKYINGKIAVATMGEGFYISKNGVDSWQAINDGLEDTRLNSIIIKDKNLYITTESRGVFTLAIDKLNYLAINNNKTNQLFLNPNPALNYISLPETTFPKLEINIYNYYGMNMPINLFDNNSKVDIKGFPSGIYFVLLNGTVYKFIKA